MRMKYTINVDQRGLLFKDGRVHKVLQPGQHSHFTFQNMEVAVYKVGAPFLPAWNLQTLLEDEKLRAQLDVYEVADHELALVFENKNLRSVLRPGMHAYWKSSIKRQVKIYDTSQPTLPDDLPRALCENPVLSPYITIYSVPPGFRGLLYFDQVLQKELEPGQYAFWNAATKVMLSMHDGRQQQVDMTGQEILTKDKITLRLNFVCQFKIVDPVKLEQKISNYVEQMYIALQLVLREYVGNLRLDELLEQKQRISDFVLEELQKRMPDWGLEFVNAGVKDIVLPGEVKRLLEKVLEAEKDAQANIIKRREETASTRSLLNTADLMEQKPLLFRLKEMEHIESISQRIASINLHGGDSVAAQLTRLLQSPGGDIIERSP